MKTFRHRYIVVQALRLPPCDDRESLLVEAVLTKIGEQPKPKEPIGFRFRVIEYDEASIKWIVRITPHTAVEKMKKLISTINQFRAQPLEMHVIGTSGTIKALKRRYMRDLSENMTKTMRGNALPTTPNKLIKP
jgi:RNase P/RNase MRP subunit POP5